ncbi:MAG: hypothetical protein ACOC1G_07185 [Phycisphaeraceae bacterium]
MSTRPPFESSPTQRSLRTRWLSLAIAVCMAVPALFAGAATAAPEPELVSPSWNLEFTYDKPHAIAVKNLEGETKWYWYMTYEVTNKTGRTQLFVPEVTVADDTGRIMQAGDDVPNRVYRAIRDKLRSVSLQSPVQILGELLEGEDHSKKGVVVWPAALDRDVDEYRVFFAGLSGETAVVEHPGTGEEIRLRRTLMIRFALPGDDEHPQRQTVDRIEQRDVMR